MKSDKLAAAIVTGLLITDLGAAHLVSKAGLACLAATTKPEYGCPEFWLNRYQSLIAGLLAVAGAFVTVLYLRRQIISAQAQSDRQLEEVRQQFSMQRSDAERAANLRVYAELDTALLKLEEMQKSRRSAKTLSKAKFPRVTFAEETRNLMPYGYQLTTDLFRLARSLTVLADAAVEPSREAIADLAEETSRLRAVIGKKLGWSHSGETNESLDSAASKGN